MCNSITPIDPGYREELPEGRGYKIFYFDPSGELHSVIAPLSRHPTVFYKTGEWITFKPWANYNRTGVDGFCHFLDSKEAGRALDVWRCSMRNHRERRHWRFGILQIRYRKCCGSKLEYTFAMGYAFRVAISPEIFIP